MVFTPHDIPWSLRASQIKSRIKVKIHKYLRFPPIPSILNSPLLAIQNTSSHARDLCFFRFFNSFAFFAPSRFRAGLAAITYESIASWKISLQQSEGLGHGGYLALTMTISLSAVLLL